jgi:hypothetical protein
MRKQEFNVKLSTLNCYIVHLILVHVFHPEKYMRRTISVERWKNRLAVGKNTVNMGPKIKFCISTRN